MAAVRKKHLGAIDELQQAILEHLRKYAGAEGMRRTRRIAIGVRASIASATSTDVDRQLELMVRCGVIETNGFGRFRLPEAPRAHFCEAG